MNKDTQKLMFSSKSNEWGTPQDFYDKLNREFGLFTLDAAASKVSTKCAKYFNKEENSLEQSWKGENVFLNPPYGRGLKDWVKKAWDASLYKGTSVTLLVPARTDTQYFHDYCMKAEKIIFVRGRLKFVDLSIIEDGEEPKYMPAPFPSMVVYFRNHNVLNVGSGPQFGTMLK